MQSVAARWIDLGSGAGLPAIPLAIAGVGEQWTLVESRRQKTLFMRKIIQELELKNIRVVHSRLEDMVATGDHRAAFDAFTSRATMRLGPTLGMAAQLIHAGGLAYLWKGGQREAEMKHDSSWRESWEFSEPMVIGNGQSEVAKFIRKD